MKYVILIKGDKMLNYYITCLKKYIDFSGRATRSEYWCFVLINLLISLVLSLVNIQTIGSIYQLLVLIPNLSVFWRRMHDINRSGCNLFWMLLPIIGWIIVLVYLVSPTKPSEK